MKKALLISSFFILSTLTSFAQWKALSKAAKSTSRASRTLSRTSKAEVALAKSKPIPKPPKTSSVYFKDNKGSHKIDVRNNNNKYQADKYTFKPGGKHTHTSVNVNKRDGKYKEYYGGENDPNRSYNKKPPVGVN